MVRLFKRFAFTSLLLICAAFAYSQTMPLGPYGNIPLLGTNNYTTSAVVPALQLSGIVSVSGGSTATLTTDTATAICAAFPFVGTSNAQGWNYTFFLKNVNSSTLTFAAGSGVTLVGTATTATVSMRPVIVTLLNCTPGSAAVTMFLGPVGTY